MVLNSAQLLAVEYIIAVMGLYLWYKCMHLKKDNMNHFMRFVMVLNAFLIINIPIRYIELHLVNWNRFFVFCLYAISVILMTFTMACWFVFDLKQIGSKLVDTSVKLNLCIIPAFLVIPLSIANYWTGWLYVIDESSWYSRGSLFVLQALISYIYFFVIILSNAIHMASGKEKMAAKKCFIATIPAIIGAAMQIVYGGSYLLIGTVFGAFLLYVEICLDRQKAYEMSEAVSNINRELIHSNKEIANNVKTILALSDIYYTLYEVDLKNDTFKEIKASKVVSNFCSRYQSARECMRDLPRAMFAAGYVGIMQTLFDPESINDYLKNTNSYCIDAIGKFSKDWIRTTVIATERDVKGNITQFVYTFQQIGEIVEQKKKIEEVKIHEIHAQEMKELFIETADALASAIDAKDKYTHGHSRRVAEFSRKIAELAGKSETECEKIYFAGLLHDVGKIGIQDDIICKEGKLTEEEYEIIKQHPAAGKSILERISKLPYLGEGANYHHERYDGKGYPSGLKGEEIPEIARIIAVADAYDAMTSKRSYRNPIPQQIVREEIIKGIETQFDPDFAKIMIHLIDKDLEYQMRENNEVDDANEETELVCEKYRTNHSHGIRINEQKLKLRFSYESKNDIENAMPAFVFFDSLDANIHVNDGREEELYYHEYGELKANGFNVFDGVRKIQFEEEILQTSNNAEGECIIEAVKENDHMRFVMEVKGKIITATVALPNSSRFVYISITGENCWIKNIEMDREEQPVEEGTIQRIIEEETYLSGAEGDVPSIQVDGYRTSTTEGVLLDRDKDISFDMMSFPYARLLWHCPYIVIYSSSDGQVYGENYREYALVRLDGEIHNESENVINNYTVKKTDEFPGWNQWKKDNIQGRNCNVSIKKEKNRILLKTVTGGIEIDNETIITEDVKDIFITLTGDQCTIENIHVQ